MKIDCQSCSLSEAVRKTLAQGRDSQILAACIAALGVLVTFAFVRNLSLAFLQVPLDPREGWNAYHAAAAFGGRLYPVFPSMMFNNYPPVSFLLVGGLGKLIGDNIVAGRLLALISTAGTALCVGAAARSMGCRKIEAALSALLFVASPWILSNYAVIDDPQMLGQFLGCAGFALVVRRTGNGRAIAAGALLLTLAGFTKQMFVSQPLALVVWLAIYEPRNALRLGGYMVLLAILGIVAAKFIFGTILIEHIVSARVYAFSRAISHPGTWLITGFVPLAATLYLFRYLHDRYASLCAIYAVTAIVFGVFFSGGQGVAGNAMFDASIAVALGAGVFINRIRAGAVPPGLLGARPAAKFTFACAVPIAIAFVAQMLGAHPAAFDRAIARADIGFVGAQPGPALCEMLSFCYWAHKAPQVDTFNLTQAFMRHARSETDLVRLLDARYFQAIQLDRRSAFPARLRCSVAQNYRLDHTDEFGVFLLPRQEASSAKRTPC